MGGSEIALYLALCGALFSPELVLFRPLARSRLVWCSFFLSFALLLCFSLSLSLSLSLCLTPSLSRYLARAISAYLVHTLSFALSIALALSGREESIFIEVMTSDRKLQASRKGSN